jgi:hypothetical protein
MDPRDDEAMLGAPLRRFLRELKEESRNGREYQIHYVTAREMANIVMAACDGCEGNPNDYRDYRLQLIANGRSEYQKDGEYQVCSAD